MTAGSGPSVLNTKIEVKKRVSTPELTNAPKKKKPDRKLSYYMYIVGFCRKVSLHLRYTLYQQSISEHGLLRKTTYKSLCKNKMRVSI